MKVQGKAKAWFVFVLFISAVFFTAGNNTVLAQDEGISAGGFGVKLVTERDEPNLGYYKLELKPGESFTGKFEITNNSEDPKTFDIYKSDAFNTEDGTFAGGNLDTAVLDHASTWISMDRLREVIPPKSRKIYEFTFTVPGDCSPGDHMALIYIQPDDDDATTGETDERTETPDETKEKKASFKLKVVTRIGILVWQRTPGELTLGAVFSDTLEKSFSRGQLQISFELENTGNTFMKPELGWRLVDNKGRAFLTRRKSLYGYLLPGGKNIVRIPVVSQRPIPRGEYTLKVEMTDEKSDFKGQNEYQIELP